MTKANTYDALMRRGIGSKLASDLVQDGHAIKSLKLKTHKELVVLGFNEIQVKNLLDESRPPIPDDTFIKVLVDSKYVCCVCRDSHRGIIIHHLKEWSEGGSHDYDNLVLICLHHHDEAHTNRKLSLELNTQRLKKIRNIWYEKCKTQDALTVVNKMNTGYASWDYFNHNRLVELLPKMNQIDVFKIDGYEFLLSKKIIGPKGIVNGLNILTNDNSRYMYQSGTGINLADYHRRLFGEILKRLPIINISSIPKRGIINIVKTGDYIVIEKAFYFKAVDSKKDTGIGQTRTCRNRGDIVINFQFDAFESLSMTSWGYHMSGYKTILTICQVRTIEKSSDKLILHCSCLAIGASAEFENETSSILDAKFAWSNFEEDDETDNQDEINDEF